ncbi:MULTISPECIES: DUF6013 family protein [Burkholderia]|nr:MULTISPECIES: DUF6013 family protein [Burkholderia]AJY18182.1 hypothetical protein NP80_1839 [Burkholderia multivorans ATCC BAA-247]AOJ94480.1 hypothetical protein WK22_07770 [Burkholderia multivorans]AVR23627.1 hypothetical protein A8H40_22905 [Burkholderia multivorans]EKS9915803.1 hypothetical protein [Burkholderia multivorans]KOE26390.1 hypothetical protein AI46_08080 [Burkholderia multivorans R-20526]
MSQRSLSVAAAWSVAIAAVCVSANAVAAPPVKGSLKGGGTGQLEYTVKVDSKTFGSMQETRKIRSGETDDFNWKSVPPSGAVAMPDGCPNAQNLPRDANGAMVRQTQVRLAPSVDAKGIANVQMSFQAAAPKGTRSVTAGGKSLQCPDVVAVSQVKWVSLSTNGGSKSITMNDGTKVTVSIKR